MLGVEVHGDEHKVFEERCQLDPHGPARAIGDSLEKGVFDKLDNHVLLTLIPVCGNQDLHEEQL